MLCTEQCSVSTFDISYSIFYMEQKEKKIKANAIENILSFDFIITAS